MPFYNLPAPSHASLDCKHIPSFRVVFRKCKPHGCTLNIFACTYVTYKRYAHAVITRAMFSLSQ